MSNNSSMIPIDIFINHFYPYITFNTCIRLCSIKSYRTFLFSFWNKGNEKKITSIGDLLLDSSNRDQKILRFFINTTKHPFTNSTLSNDLIVESMIKADLKSKTLPFFFNSTKVQITSSTRKRLRKLIINKAIETGNSDIIKTWRYFLNISYVKYLSLKFKIDSNKKLMTLDDEITYPIDFGYYSNKYELNQLYETNLNLGKEVRSELFYKSYLIGWATWDLQKTGNIKLITNNPNFTLEEFFSCHMQTNILKNVVKYFNDEVITFLLKFIQENFNFLILPLPLSDFLDCDLIDNSLLIMMANIKIDSDYKHGEFIIKEPSFKSFKDVNRIEEILKSVTDKISVKTYGLLNMLYHERALIYLHDRKLWHKLFLPDCPNEIFKILDHLMKKDKDNYNYLPRFIMDKINNMARTMKYCQYYCNKMFLCIFPPVQNDECIHHINKQTNTSETFYNFSSSNSSDEYGSD